MQFTSFCYSWTCYSQYTFWAIVWRNSRILPCLLCMNQLIQCATTGASLCYIIADTLGRNLVQNKFPDKLKSMNKRIEDNRDNLPYYMLFLRITPLIPNWFVNISSPIVGVSLKIFFFGTFFG